MIARTCFALLWVGILAGCDCGAGKGVGGPAEQPLCTELREGCACDAPAPVSCYEGAAGLSDVGVCMPGQRFCLDGVWGPCEGQVFPRDELCGDGLDNDCDGEADEAGRCECQDGCTEQGAECFAGAQIAGLVTSGEGALTLATREVAIGDAWIANTQGSSVSRIDTIRGVEVARYASVNDGNHGAPSANLGCDPDQVVANAPTGNCPSRTAVASNGDAFVANRAFGSQATVSHIAGRLDRCIDKNGNGVIETSTDLNGDGTISTDPAAGEYLGQRDECILWTAPVGNPGDVARALAIAPSNDPGLIGEVWVGLYFARLAIALDARDGHEIARVRLDVQPYGAAASRDGRIWFTETDWSVAFGLQAVDSATHLAEPAIDPPVVDGCMGSYGIAVDELGRVWRGAHPCTGVFRYDPADGSWRRFSVGDNGASLGVTADGAGRIWAVFFRDAAHNHVARVARFDTENGVVDRSWDLTGTIEDPWGVGLDGEGDAWVISRGSDRAVEIDPDTGETRTVLTGDEPYTYSDFTGYQLDLVTDRTGYVDLVFEGCENADTEWYDVVADAAVPAGSRLELFVKSADDGEALEATPWRGPMASPADVRAERGRLLAVRAQLWSAEDPHVALPILRDVSAAHRCPDAAE